MLDCCFPLSSHLKLSVVKIINARKQQPFSYPQVDILQTAKPAGADVLTICKPLHTKLEQEGIVKIYWVKVRLHRYIHIYIAISAIQHNHSHNHSHTTIYTTHRWGPLSFAPSTYMCTVHSCYIFWGEHKRAPI